MLAAITYPGKRLHSRSQEYYEVRIYKNRYSMRRGFNRLTGRTLSPKAIACVQRSKGIDPQIGWVFFCRPFLTVETLAHEATHMAVWYTKRRKNKSEEELAYTIGGVTASLRKFFKKYMKEDK